MDEGASRVVTPGFTIFPASLRAEAVIHPAFRMISISCSVLMEIIYQCSSAARMSRVASSMGWFPSTSVTTPIF